MKVVIVGAGFAGLNAAKRLGSVKGIDITLVDRRNYHLFQPLLYQVAMAALSPAEIAMPIRAIVWHHRNIDVRLGNVTAVDMAAKTVTTDGEALSYDRLILACGAKHSYFGHGEWEDMAPGLKTLEQATEIRRRMLLAFELADKEKDAEKQKRLLTFVVVGGGPTGVELAGALGEISRYTLARDFRHIDPARTRIVLIEAGPRILAAFHESLARRATGDLERLGVQVWTGARVLDVTAAGVRLPSEFLSSATVLWAAGVQPSSLGRALSTPLDAMGRVVVGRDLTVPGHSDVFVLGDQAHVEDLRTKKPLPGLSPVAIQQGLFAARQILNDVKGSSREEFHYKDKGIMATIGRKTAIVEVGRLRFGGFFAWWTWLLVHIYYLIGFRNRLLVLIQWAWAYLTFSRGARLIVHKECRLNPPPRK